MGRLGFDGRFEVVASLAAWQRPDSGLLGDPPKLFRNYAGIRRAVSGQPWGQKSGCL